jgi:manganese transport protein
MPHVVYLHSGLTRDRFGHPGPGPARRRLLRATRVDVGSAMLLAGTVNLAMLLLAARTLRDHSVDTIDGAHAAIRDQLGPTVALLFALGLLASGLASTSVGAHAGASIMAGLLRRRVPLLVRRVVTLLPALVVLGFGVDPTRALVLSQVVLSFGLPLALIPLVRLTGDRALMGVDVNRPSTTVCASVVVGLIIFLNAVLIYQTLT